MTKAMVRLVLFCMVCVLAACDDPVKVQDSCGDDFLDPGEQCDTNQLSGATCLNSGYYDEDGEVRCSASCEYDYSDCGEARCGDAIIQGAYEEQCEGGDLGGNSCVTLGYFRGTLSCTASCRYDLTDCEAGGYCGDGVLQEGDEQCDGNELGDATCEGLGRYGGELGCDDGCQYDLSTCAGRCGDGEVDAEFSEECDGGNLGQETCESQGFSSGELTCDACRLVTDACVPYCGDGALQPGQAEECDGTLLGGQTCRTRGWIFGGDLVCDAGCLFDEAPCRSIVQLAAGAEFTCALLSDGTAACWGRNEFGTCGDGLTTYLPQNLPNPVAGLSGAVRLQAGGNHACALLADGTVRCWGLNFNKQLGHPGGPFKSSSPIEVTGLTGAVAIGGGYNHTCVVLSDGTVRCWGVNYQGQLGIGTTGGEYDTPVTPSGVTGAAAVVAGIDHTCVLLSSGGVQCFGDSFYGQCGDGYNVDRPTPVAVYGLTTATALAAGENHTCALLANGQVHCWGRGEVGALGTGNTGSNYQPFAVPGLFGVAGISAGTDNTCVVFSDRTVQCWGENWQGQVGDGTSQNQRLSPVVIPELVNTVMTSHGSEHGCAVLDGGRRAMCWGYNGYGRLGDGTTTQRLSPVAVVVP